MAELERGDQERVELGGEHVEVIADVSVIRSARRGCPDSTVRDGAPDMDEVRDERALRIQQAEEIEHFGIELALERVPRDVDPLSS